MAIRAWRKVAADLVSVPDSTFRRVAALAHVGWGLGMTLAFDRWMAFYWAAGLTVVIAAAKESIESLWGVWDQPPPAWISAVEDTSEFVIGIVIAAVVVFL